MGISRSCVDSSEGTKDNMIMSAVAWLCRWGSRCILLKDMGWRRARLKWGGASWQGLLHIYTTALCFPGNIYHFPLDFNNDNDRRPSSEPCEPRIAI